MTSQAVLTRDTRPRYVPGAAALDRQPRGTDRLRRAGARRYRGEGRGGCAPVVLAALDGGPATWSVVDAARRMADLLGGVVRAVYARPAGTVLPARLAAPGVPLRILDGDVRYRLPDAVRDREVAVLVLGARALAGDPRPLGSTAAHLVTTVDKPVVVVPPDADPVGRIEHVLVPLEGTTGTSSAPRELSERAIDAGCAVTAIHVRTADDCPQCTDDGPVERASFLAEHCAWGRGLVDLVIRTGIPEQSMPDAVWEQRGDLVVLGWSQRLVPGRARVVRALLSGSPAPVVLVPVPAPTPAVPVRALHPRTYFGIAAPGPR